METKRPYICARACRHVAAPDLLGAGGQFLPLVRGPVTIQGVRDPWGVRDSAGVRTSMGGPEPPAVRADRLLLPEHVVLPDLSQPGDGTVVG